jgi:hypothetical protein
MESINSLAAKRAISLLTVLYLSGLESNASDNRCTSLSMAFLSTESIDQRTGETRLRMAPAMDFLRTAATQLKDGASARVLTRIGEWPVWRFDFPSTSPASDGLAPIRVIMTAGVHGNEPLGVTTAMQTIKAFMEIPDLRRRFSLTVIPNINPKGLQANTRQTPEGMDLNRAFALESWPAPFEQIRKSIQDERFDLAIDLHGALSRDGFFVIRGSEDPGVAQRALSRIRAERLLESDSANYPGFVATSANPRAYLFDAAGSARSETEGTLKGYFRDRGVAQSFTLEYPGELELKIQSLDYYRLALATMYVARMQLSQSKSP